ncbi:hypothetical protein [Ulvibacter antarcticus]|uniref:Lipocalin-like protein n=1 Tax=Ulvibacter antarcticus TaxID=442714 RepID=A0A3L9Y8N2_9FLAO|nr:hypothetical protein [Ulvibacter antarcticus]RMA57051.1 hypothetical protein BXY75_2932 [Ulvibacter antarcticus]
MKKKIASIMVVVTCFMVFAACSKDNNSDSNSDTAVQLTSIARTGNWQITYFYDTDHEETGNFSGYSFTFKEDGSVVAVNGNTTVTGTWSISTGSGSSSDDDGSSSNDIDFNLFFSSPADFDELSDDWDIVSYSDSKIELIDVSGGNGGTDYLTFEKI